jgi:hypothetical protein
MFRYCEAGIVRIVRARKIADFYQIKRKSSQKWSTESLKSIKKAGTVRARTLRTPPLKFIKK